MSDRARLRSTASRSEGERTNRVMLPGTSYNDSWLLANEALRANFAERQGMLPNYRRYRLLQVIHSYKKRHYEEQLSAKAVKPLQQRMLPGERIAAAAPAVAFSLLALLPKNLFSAIEIPLRRIIGQHTFQPEEYGPGSSSDLVEVYHALDMKSAGVAAQASVNIEA